MRRLKLQLEKMFGKYFKMYSYNINETKTIKKWLKKIRNIFVVSKPNLLQKLMKNIEMTDIFTSNGELCDGDNSLMIICHPGYMFFFMITYMHTLKNLLEKVLKNNFESDRRDNNIWYGVSVDKILLDTVFGSKKKLEKLFYASGMIQRKDNLRKAKFSTRGEKILPAIQQKFAHLEFKMKSYFVVAQMFSKHVQLTLHQVVKLASYEEDAVAIAIRDEIVQIDDVLDSLCKKVLMSIPDNFQINYCDIHKKKDNVSGDFNSIQTFLNLCQNLKPCITTLVG